MRVITCIILVFAITITVLAALAMIAAAGSVLLCATAAL
jgi:hypothetical protein